MPLTKSIINNDFDLFKKTVISLNLSLFKNQNITSFQYNLQTIPQTWNSLIKNLNKKYSYVAQEKGFHDFGKRITNAAQGLYQVLNNTRYRTIIHGDLNRLICFFNNDSCSVCDFQFSGAGVPLQDVVYFYYLRYLLENGWMCYSEKK
ncbi:hypothetical protein LY90DRAFT_709379 [Neocallimastix californiae]|uniref:Uncharacterized protein n=1 Tax=Neocallimastix californiae TaxID=1754190 RepID=A0A1Y1YYM6_9FUNG|nr:hypothetical protein LY90DRAFT_709379 [Neocallimastix californiae]|eukprot:ORY03069.1 hypothetical protein LY90DRAFT_709379 [Neocallimastix californiae]